MILIRFFNYNDSKMYVGFDKAVGRCGGGGGRGVLCESMTSRVRMRTRGEKNI